MSLNRIMSRLTAARCLRLEQLEARLALATLFVSNSGNDANDGSSATPWATLQKAANVVNAGDTIIVRAGNYVGFDLRRDGTATNRIVFQAEAGVNITSRNAVTPDGINLEGADYVTIDGFTVNNMPRTGIRTVTNNHVIIRNNHLDNNAKWGILTGFSDDLLIENNVASRSQIEHGIYVGNSADRPIIRNNTVWGNNANGIHMNGDIFAGGGDGIITGALVEGNIIYGNGAAGGSGINADGVQDSIFRNNLIYDTHASGISLYQIDGGGASTNNVVVNNTVLVASNGRWALNIQSGSTGNTVRNNILLNLHSFRGSIDISADSLPGFTSDYNVVMNRLTTDGGNSIQTLAQWQTSTGQDQHSLVATPTQVFVNSAALDFHILAASPAVNAGTSSFAPTADIEGNVRPQGSSWDVGAYEVLSPGSVSLQQATYTVSETAGSLLVSAVRASGSSGAVSVAYATANGTAIAGQDFTATSGTLTWANGETGAKSFSIPVTNDAIFESDETFSISLSSPTNGLTLGTNAAATITLTSDDPQPLAVSTFATTSTGVTVDFNRALDSSKLNLYDIQGGVLGPADVTLVGTTSGIVRGSVVVDSNQRKLTFIRTGGLLLPDSYTLTLRSAVDGVQDAGGSLLDGDGDGSAGGNYVRTFTVAAPPANRVTVSLPDFARGPKQAVNLPAEGTSGIPLTFSDAAGITSATMQLKYDPAILSINSAAVAAGLPVGSAVSLSTNSGVATILFSSPTPLPAGTTTFVNLQASVPETATYRNKQVLDLGSIVVNGGAIPAIDDDSVQVVSYFGDVTGNGAYSAQDAALVARLAVGLDGGLQQFKLLDPILMADINGNSAVTALDTSRILQASVGLSTTEIPALPTPAFSLVQGGPDPKLSIPTNLAAVRGGQVLIPVMIDSIVDLTGNGLQSADLVIYYDATALDVTKVTLGGLLKERGDWFVTAHNDPLAGRIFISLAGTTPLEGFFQGELVQLQATVKETARVGRTAINLAASARNTAHVTQLNEGFLTLIPAPTDAANDSGVDGLLTISANPKATQLAQAVLRNSDGQLVISGTKRDDRILIGRLNSDRIRVRVNQQILGEYPLPTGIVVEGTDRAAKPTAAQLTSNDLALLQLLQSLNGDNDRPTTAATKRFVQPRR